MANNVAATPGTGATFKTTDNAGVHTGHVNVDTLPTPTTQQTSGSAIPTSVSMIGVSDGTNAQRVIAPIALADGVNGNNMVAAGNYVWNGTTWDRVPGTVAGGLFVMGAAAHDAADSGNPVKVGGKAVSAEPAAVTAADRANFITDLVGKLITLPYANPENFVSGAITSAMTSTTTTSLLAAPAAGLRNYITQITVSNAHATVGTDVIIQDGSGGTTLYTIPAAAVYGGAVLTFPVPLRQPTTATAIYCANVTTGASTKVSASGYKGV